MRRFTLPPAAFRLRMTPGAASHAARAARRCGNQWRSGLLDGFEVPAGFANVRFQVGLPPRPRSGVQGASQTGPQCVQGALGERAVEIMQAQSSVAEARQELGEHQARYDIAAKSCWLALESAEDVQQAQSAHRDTMSALGAVKLGADLGAEMAATISDCASLVVNADESNPFTAIVDSAAASVGCGARIAEGALKATSLSMATAMDEAERSHALIVQQLEANGAYGVCMNDASAQLVGQRTAELAIERAALDLTSAYARLRNDVEAAQDIWRRARASHAAEEGLSITPPEATSWLDEDVRAYLRDFRLARRGVYLAVRAVEYEYQTSLLAREDALSAETPDQLEAVLQTLWAAAGTRSIGGNRPTDLEIVVSLRDHLLALADHEALRDSEQALSAAERFRLLLQSPAYAVYDDDGDYTGQRIPFSLVPFDAFGVGDAAGVAVLSGQSDCAERLWSVNASLIGAEDLFEGSDTTFARIDLLKENEFFSQWCAPPSPNEPALQVASVRPGRNLFREPGLGATVGTEVSHDDASRARIEAYFNVSRGELEHDDYRNGDTSELAARGLYGDYALFLPSAVLSRERIDGSRTSGIVLDRVDDILLRLDYVSVAR